MGGFLLVVALIGALIWDTIYTHTEHWKPKEGNDLKAGATIDDVSTTRRNKKVLKTTITFSDGFRYISYKTKSEPAGFLTWRIYVDQEMKLEMLDRAVRKHEELLHKV